jgi:hypothetical protein
VPNTAVTIWWCQNGISNDIQSFFTAIGFIDRGIVMEKARVATDGESEFVWRPLVRFAEVSTYGGTTLTDGKARLTISSSNGRENEYENPFSLQPPQFRFPCYKHPT